MGFSIYKSSKMLAQEAQKRRDDQILHNRKVAEKREQLEHEIHSPSALRRLQREEEQSEAARLKAREDAYMAPIRKLEEESNKLQRELRKTQANILLTQIDPERFVEAVSVKDESEKIEFIREQYRLFVEDNPEWEDTKENRDSLGKYFHVNGIILPTVATIAHAAERLEGTGLIKRKAAPKAEPAQKPWKWVQDVDFNTAKPDDVVAGAHWETGQPCSITIAQLNRLSTDQYRRFIGKDFREKDTEKQEYRERGIDPDTREERWYTAREIDKMNPEQIRKTFVLGRKLANIVQQPDLISNL